MLHLRLDFIELRKRIERNALFRAFLPLGDLSRFRVDPPQPALLNDRINHRHTSSFQKSVQLISQAVKAARLDLDDPFLADDIRHKTAERYLPALHIRFIIGFERRMQRLFRKRADAALPPRALERRPPRRLKSFLIHSTVSYNTDVIRSINSMYGLRSMIPLNCRCDKLPIPPGAAFEVSLQISCTLYSPC